MKITNKFGTFFPCMAALVTSCGLAQAQIMFSSGGSLTAWNGAPIYTSIANSGLSGATTAQNDANTITGTYGLMAETFTPSSSFTLGSFALLLGVNNPTSPTYIVNLYNLGPAGTVSVSSSTATYNPYTPSPAGIALSFSDTVTFSGGSGGEVQGTFTLPSADQVSLIAGEEYSLEILTPTNDGPSGITWYRGGAVDSLGQMFSSPDGLNSAGGGARNTLAGNGQAGGAPRTGTLALYTVPEPGTLALMGVGGFLSMLAIRRRKS
jgi:PEP-CTERM motif